MLFTVKIVESPDFGIFFHEIIQIGIFFGVLFPISTDFSTMGKGGISAYLLGF
jgi:hypothetical protein